MTLIGRIVMWKGLGKIRLIDSWGVQYDIDQSQSICYSYIIDDTIYVDNEVDFYYYNSNTLLVSLPHLTRLKL